MIKHIFCNFLIFISTVYSGDMVKIKLKSGKINQGEWIGTYSGHVHILIEDNLNYFACDEILSVMIEDRTSIEKTLVSL